MEQSGETASSLIYERVRLQTLNPSDRAAWRALCDTHPLPASPLVTPDFAEMVASVRDDVWCILARQNEQLVAALAYHKRPWGFARPIGAPFDDTSGPVIAEGVDVQLADMLASAEIDAYRAQATCAAPDHLSGMKNAVPSETHGIYLGDLTATQYLEQQRSLHTKRFKNFRRLGRKMESERGAIEFRWGAPDPQRLATLLKWKSDQFQSNGLLDVIHADLSGKVLQRAAETTPNETSDLSGFMTELLIDGRLITGHFGVRTAASFHPWIAAYDPEFSDYAPGMQLLHLITEHMQDMDLTYYDLAEGHDHYKKYFAAHARPIHRIEYSAGSLQGRIHAASYDSWSMIGDGSDGATGARLRRRLDHIAACEAGLGKRLSEFGAALAKRR